MKKEIVFLTIAVFVATLAMPAWGTDPQKPKSAKPGVTPLSVPQEPDLIVEPFAVQTIGSGSYGGTYHNVVTIMNRSNGKAGPFKVCVLTANHHCDITYSGGTPLDHNSQSSCWTTPWEQQNPPIQVPGLEAGAKYTFTPPEVLSWSSQPTTNDRKFMKVIVDCRQEVAESNEHNNERDDSY